MRFKRKRLLSLRTRLPPEAYQFGRILSYCWIISAELIKIGYVTTCDCRGVGQVFNYWFFPTFQHPPYSSWFTYHGITWLGGPYSLLWYGLNSPAIFGYWTFFTYLLLADLLVFWVLFKKGRLFALYGLTLTLWFTTVDPIDFFIIIFALIGRYRLSFLILSPLTKLPIGSELLLGNFSVWHWVLTSRNSLSGPENYGRYLILGSVWLFSLCLLIFSRRKKQVFSETCETSAFWDLLEPAS